MHQNGIPQNQTSRKDQARQYNNMSTEYVSLAEADPAKRFIQYPEAMRLIGDIKSKDILDIGCGNGTFTRMLASHGARVVGYDPSEKQIEEAQNSEKQKQLGISYYLGEQPEAISGYRFDKAASVMALMYAADVEDLRKIFSYTRKLLKNGGSLSAVIFNPNYRFHGKVAYNRRFSMQPDKKVQVEFFDSQGHIKMTSMHSDFSASEYEYAAKEAGFIEVEWVKLQVTPEGKEKQGELFWEGFEDNPPYTGLNLTTV